MHPLPSPEGSAEDPARRAQPPRWLRATRWILTGLSAALGLRLCLLFAEANSRGVDFIPINGTFQTFNPIRRLALGQQVGRDFDAYLGLGPTWLTRLASTFYGTDYRSVLEASHLATSLTFWTAVALLGRLCALSTLGATVLATLVTAVATHTQPQWIGDEAWRTWVERTWPLVSPGNSLLGLRAAVPFLAVLALVVAGRSLRLEQPGRERRAALAVGALAGLCALWSNDYGFPTAALLIAAACLVYWRSGRAGWIGFVLRTCACALATVLLALTIGTGGAPWRWFEYAFLGVARDQSWYFAAGSLELDPAQALGGAGVLLLLLAKCCTSWARPTDPWLAVLVAATLAGGLIPSLAHANPHYFYPLVLVLHLVVPYLAVEGAWRLATRWRARRAPAARTRRTWLELAPTAFAAALLACLPLAVAAPTASTHAGPGEEPVRADEMGGDGPGYLAKMAVLGRELRAQSEAAGWPRDRRLLSTYAGALELFADAVSPTRDDYVIHALGPARRAAFARALGEHQPPWVSTLRADAVGWEPWVQSVCWDFYGELLARYEPFEQTAYHTLWRKRTTPRPECAALVEAEVHPLQQDGPTSRIPLTLRLAPGSGWTDPRPLLVELELEYEVLSQRSWPRHATPILYQPRAGGPAGWVGLPPYERSRRLPVSLRPGETWEGFLLLEQPGSGTLTVSAARARALGVQDEVLLARLERLLPSQYYGPGWRAGVSTSESAAGFFVQDVADLRDLQPGARLNFAHSGVRTVQRISGREVWVDGAPLVPRHDGHPHWIGILPP